MPSEKVFKVEKLTEILKNLIIVDYKINRSYVAGCCGQGERRRLICAA